MDNIPTSLLEQYDYVIDSSVTDVFMQMTSAKVPQISTAKQVHSRLHSTLKKNGIMVVFSMNRNPWKKIYRHFKERISKYLIIRPTFNVTTKRGRSTSRTGDDVLVLVSAPPDTELVLRDVPNEVEGASIIDTWSNEVPDDWQGVRD